MAACLAKDNKHRQEEQPANGRNAQDQQTGGTGSEARSPATGTGIGAEGHAAGSRDIEEEA